MGNLCFFLKGSSWVENQQGVLLVPNFEYIYIYILGTYIFETLGIYTSVYTYIFLLKLLKLLGICFLFKGDFSDVSFFNGIRGGSAEVVYESSVLHLMYVRPSLKPYVVFSNIFYFHPYLRK